MARVARRLVGQRADPERFGAAMVLALFVLLGLLVSWSLPWTSWGVVRCAYYPVMPLTAFGMESWMGRSAVSRTRIRLLIVALAIGMVLLLYPSALAGSLASDLSHAATTFFAGAVVGAVFTAIKTRPSTAK